MTLPFLLSVPHAGLIVPQEVEDICLLTEQEIIEDGDEGAADIYFPLKSFVLAFVTTNVARAIVDMNRAEDDFRKDGIVKTHTCWNVPIYKEVPTKARIDTLLDHYYHPYHDALTKLASEVKLGIDCHTMAAYGPPVGPDPDQKRPAACLSNADGTCPKIWLETLADELSTRLGHEVAINHPFKGGYIIRSHAHETPWLQLEYSRGDFLTSFQKSACLLDSLKVWAQKLGF